MANGEKTQIRGEGSGVISGVDDNGENVKISMAKVKYVPGLATSLISVGRLAKKNLKVVFEEDSCNICDQKEPLSRPELAPAASIACGLVIRR